MPEKVGQIFFYLTPLLILGSLATASHFPTLSSFFGACAVASLIAMIFAWLKTL